MNSLTTETAVALMNYWKRQQKAGKGKKLSRKTHPCPSDTTTWAWTTGNFFFT
jgi:hypothetical protein